MRKFVLMSVLVVLTTGLIPTGGHAGHCQPIFIISGEDSIREPTVDLPPPSPFPVTKNSRIAGANLGSASCPPGVSNPHLSATNYLTPGAPEAWGGLDSNIGNPIVGTGTINGTTATWTHNEFRSRWETQTVAIGSATSITFNVTYREIATGIDRTATVTYSKAA